MSQSVNRQISTNVTDSSTNSQEETTLQNKIRKLDTKKKSIEETPPLVFAKPAPAATLLDDDNDEIVEDDDNEMDGEDNYDLEYEEYSEEGMEIEENEQTVQVNKFITSKEISDLMVKLIEECQVLLPFRPTQLRLLLSHFKWDKSKMLEAYYEGRDETVFKKVTDNCPINLESSLQASSSSAKAEECQICCCEVSSNEMYGIMRCGHKFCKLCWSHYLSTQITEAQMGLYVTCAAHNCPIFLEDEVATDLLTSEDLKLKYGKRICESFIQSNRLMCLCPSTNCTNIIQVKKIDSRRPTRCASCGFTFCFQCTDNYHPTVNCDLLKQWKNKNVNDSETSKWIVGFTKSCPVCKVPIEKNDGCNHMSCRNRNPVCTHEFCWVCLQPWKNHVDCNKFVDVDLDLKQAHTTALSNRELVKRYTFYFDRYMNHMNSMKFSEKLNDSVQEIMENMEKHLDVTWSHVQFLLKAVEVLMECRNTLTYTYVFLFYVRKNNQVTMFEDNQTDLENATEKLAQYLERDVNDMESVSKDLEEIRNKVMDLYKYCDSRRQVLVHHANEGYERDLWVFNKDL